MTLEDTLTRSLHDHLDPVVAPPVDLAAVRRAGERRRAATAAGGMLAVLALLSGGTAVATWPGPDDGTPRPAELPAMDFGDGMRVFYDDGGGDLHIGGTQLPLGRANELDLSAAATPWGAVYVTPEQEVRIIEEDGTDRQLTAAPEDPGTFHPRVKYDAVDPLAAWLTREGDDVVLTVYRFGDEEGIVGTATVPCDGDACEWQQVAGVDHRKVFVREPRGGTQVFDVDDLAAAPVQLPSFTVADVRNYVILGEGVCCGDHPLGPQWRPAAAEGPESLLTFDGTHEVFWSSTLRSTDGSDPVELDVPESDGVEFTAVDSDGSVMLAVMTSRGNTYYDCEPTTGECEQFARLGRGSGDPVFLGNDM